MVRRTSTCAWRLRRPRALWPWVARRRLSCATTRCTAARSCSGPLGSARSSSFSGRDGGSRLARSMASRSSSRRRWASKRRRASRGSSSASPRATACGSRCALAAAQLQGAADALHVDADDARALALAPEGRDGQAGEVAQRGVVALAYGLGDALAQLREVDLRATGVELGVLLGDVVLERLGLGRTKEEALEDEVEDAAVLGGLGQRRRQRFLDLAALRPADLAQRRERVEQLRGPDGHALGAQLLGQLEQPRGQPGRRRVSPCLRSGWHPPGRRAARPPARRRCRGRCGA